MKKKKGFMEKISSGKGFYIFAALSICVIMGAIAFVYNMSVGMIENAIPETTARVQKSQQGVKDPRTTAPTEKKTSPEASTRVTNEPSKVVTTTKKPEPTAAPNSFYVLPVEGEIIKQFSITPVFDETMEDWRSHGGTDFRLEKGKTVAAAGNGIVEAVIYDADWGLVIEIDHGDFLGRYCGLEQGTTVKIGDIVERGQAIGSLGELPCESSAESHLHFEAVKDGDRVNPLSFFEEK